MSRDAGSALAPAPAPAPAPALAPAPAPAPGQVYLPEWRRMYDRLAKMLRQACEQAEELSIEREHLLLEIEFLRSSRRKREEISQSRIKQIYKDAEHLKRVVEAETVVGLGQKERQIHGYKKLLELAEDDLENFTSCISDLAAENTELKEKLKKLESQVEISTDNSDQRKSGKDIREEIRKLKKAYKSLRSEKDKEVSELQAEKDFVWNQLKKMEDDYSGTIKSKSIEVKQATEAAQKLLRSVDELQVAAQKKDAENIRLQVEVTNAKERMLILEDELQVAAQKKDAEIIRLQVEVTNAKERMLILEDELQKLRLVKGKDLETDKSETSRMSKKDTNKANSTSMSARSQVVSGTSQVTPDRREVKTPRSRASETNQKRKRNSAKSSLSHGNQRCYTVSPMLLPPTFTAPRLKIPSSTLLR